MDNKMERLKERFYNIDFLRIIFIFFVINVHMFDKFNLGAYKNIYGNISSVTRTGYIAVDYFFIIAGFFLLFTFKDMPVINFIKKKICKFWPLMLFLFILHAIFGFSNLTNFNWYSSIMSLFFLENLGLTLQKSNIAITWFLSTLMISSIFYYYIYKYFRKENANLAVGIITFFSYILLIQETAGSFNGLMKTIPPFFNVGLMRAVAGMGLGIIVYNIYEHLKNQNYIQTAKSFLSTSIVEASLLVFVLYETGLHRIPFKNKFILIFAFAALLLMFVLKRGFFSRFFNKKRFAKYSKYVLAIYLTHTTILLLYKKLVYTNNLELLKTFPVLFVIVMYISIFVFAVLVHHLIEKPYAKKMQRLLFNNKIETTITEKERA